MNNLDKFLELIRNLESSGGKNLDHKPTATGKTAVGEYGQMPDTIRELANRKRLSGENEMLDDSMYKGSDEYISDSLSNSPDVRKHYAEQLGQRLLDKTNGNMDLAATGWLYGHNNGVNTLENKLAKDTDYQNRIKKNMPVSREPQSVDFLKLKELLRGK